MIFEPFGDGAVRFAFGTETDPRSLLEQLRGLPGVHDAVVSERHGCVYFDPGAPVPEAVLQRAIEQAKSAAAPSRTVEIRVRYDGEDLARVAAFAKLSVTEVIALHSGREYAVRAIGFQPGFAYLGEVDARIAAPRLPSPRPRVPKGAVGIAGARTGVYPFASPGGWNLIGTAVGFEAFSPVSGAGLALGDTVRFVPEAP